MTPPPKGPQPLAEGIPVDQAWRAGRRIYVRCAMQSALNSQLRDIGARWDPEVRALWVGTGKADKVIPLVQARLDRVAAVEAIKRAATANSWWLLIPYDEATLRQQAKAAGAVYDGGRKAWAAPNADVFAQLTGRAGAARQAAQEKAAAEKATRDAAAAAARQLDAAHTAAAAADRETRLIAGAGRTVIGEPGAAQGRLYGRMRRLEAEKAKPQPGEVLRLDDGTRALVLTSTVTFYGQDAVDDGMAPGGTGDEPGWYYAYRFVPVELNDAERAEDAAAAAVRADTAEIAAVIRAAGQLAHAPDGTAPSALDPVGSITVTTNYFQHNGKISIGADGQCWYRHPGWHDDYLATEAHLTDPALLERVAAILAGGTRTRGQYAINVTDPLTCPGVVPTPGPAPCGRDTDHPAHPLGRPPAGTDGSAS